MSKMLQSFKSVGFKFKKFSSTNIGKILEYKYYPNYLEDSHYTLIVFSSWIIMGDTLDEDGNRMGWDGPKKFHSDWRLYEHKNIDGSYVNSYIQTSDHSDFGKNYINNKIKDIFYRELRQNKLERILNV